MISKDTAQVWGLHGPSKDRSTVRPFTDKIANADEIIVLTHLGLIEEPVEFLDASVHITDNDGPPR